VPTAAVTRAKLTAIGQLVAVIVVPMAGLLAVLSLTAAAVALGGATIGAVVAVLINRWFAGPARRKDFMRRKASSSLLVNALEIAVLLVLGVAAALVAHGSIAALAPTALAALIMIALAASRRRVTEAF
jgi:dipeptide/tripeptide permease